jgi:hypothetical protein
MFTQNVISTVYVLEFRFIWSACKGNYLTGKEKREFIQLSVWFQAAAEKKIRTSSSGLLRSE